MRRTAEGRSWPVQRNLLQLFGDSVWIVKLPRRIVSRIDRRDAFHADATAFGLPRWGAACPEDSGSAGEARMTGATST